ncbi:peptidase E [Frankia sp. AgB1.9]|uniref:Type 1 glutamine amidotransferase-like domain-containing protein n=1 Tax=unclassified Frankia TaxID=2632575 RepID=UPI001933B334|nr:MULTISPECIES: peptidase E [unclassified Frankia]MBL7493374.1 peptidase E [Frankia sp. AgW1.1]MBL7553591.1 peptidase E [Frankia sp. AgB1.9]MBL7621540.1 peptidase E [Frankia sp. AgB1.8]
MNILATSAGYRPDGRGGARIGPMIEHAIALSEARERPRVCLLETALGDHPVAYLRWYEAMARDRPDVQASHLALFPMPNVDDVRAHLLSQDVIWVGGGSVANLLAVWRTHGLPEILADAWRAGVVLAGVSAGSLCWHVGGTTDSFGPELRPVTTGLALLPFSNTPHYDSEPGRRPLYQKLVGDGVLPPGWATDDGVGLHFRGTELVEAVADRPGAKAWRVELGDDGAVVETAVEPRLLPDRRVPDPRD